MSKEWSSRLVLIVCVAVRAPGLPFTLCLLFLFLFFVEARDKQSETIKGILQNFCAILGQMVNIEKSMLFCSKIINMREEEEISRSTY